MRTCGTLPHEDHAALASGSVNGPFAASSGAMAHPTRLPEAGRESHRADQLMTDLPRLLPASATHPSTAPRHPCPPQPPAMGLTRVRRPARRDVEPGEFGTDGLVAGPALCLDARHQGCTSGVGCAARSRVLVALGSVFLIGELGNHLRVARLRHAPAAKPPPTQLGQRGQQIRPAE
jgi:hypothetical protein